jgi:hypothetical protein
VLKVTYPEKFTAAMKSRIVANRDLRHSKSCDIEFPGHLYADYAASRFERDLFKYLAAEETEVAVHVANRELKGKSHGSPVHFADDDAVPRIGAFHFVAIDQIDVRPEFGEKIMDFADIVLPIAVGVEDEILRGVGEARNQRRAIATIGFVVDDSQEWQFLAEVFEYFSGTVFAPVVDNNHFEIVSHPANF